MRKAVSGERECNFIEVAFIRALPVCSENNYPLSIGKEKLMRT